MKKVSYWGHKILGVTIQNLAARATWSPGFVHSWYTATSLCSVQPLKHSLQFFAVLKFRPVYKTTNECAKSLSAKISYSGLDFSSSVAGSCEHGNERSSYINAEKFIRHLSDSYFLTKNSVSLN
jgi:hypothetical protein